MRVISYRCVLKRPVFRWIVSTFLQLVACSLLHEVVFTMNSQSFHQVQLSRIPIRENLSEVLFSVRFVCRLFSFAMCGGLSYSGIDLLNC